MLVIPARGGKPRILTTGMPNGAFPTFSRDGRWIYFCVVQSGEGPHLEDAGIGRRRRTSQSADELMLVENFDEQGSVRFPPLLTRREINHDNSRIGRNTLGHNPWMLRVAVLLTFSLLISTTASTAPLEIDDFENGTTAGWHVGDPTHPSPPENVATGGPAGAGDAYLQIESVGGNGAGSRLSVLNVSQWTGDFTGVPAIGMDVNNFGPDELTLWLLLVNFAEVPGPPTGVAWTLAPVIVPAGSGWTDVLFSLSAANLFAPFGTVAGTLADVDELRIFHNPNPGFGGPRIGAPAVTAVLGIDNIGVVPDTTAVPEPASMLLMLAGLGAGARKIRAKRREQKQTP